LAVPLTPPPARAHCRGNTLQLRPLISAANATNITITGGNGTIDGNGWFAWPSANWSSPECGEHRHCAGRTYFGNSTHKLIPPHAVTFVNCSGVTVASVTITNPAFWGMQVCALLGESKVKSQLPQTDVVSVTTTCVATTTNTTCPLDPPLANHHRRRPRAHHHHLPPTPLTNVTAANHHLTTIALFSAASSLTATCVATTHRHSPTRLWLSTTLATTLFGTASSLPTTCVATTHCHSPTRLWLSTTLATILFRTAGLLTTTVTHHHMVGSTSTATTRVWST
jgi:hypothetical protein